MVHICMGSIKARYWLLWGGKHKSLRHLFGDFSQSYTKLPHLFLALEQANPICVIIWKTFDSNMSNTEIF